MFPKFNEFVCIYLLIFKKNRFYLFSYFSKNSLNFIINNCIFMNKVFLTACTFFILLGVLSSAAITESKPNSSSTGLVSPSKNSNLKQVSPAKEPLSFLGKYDLTITKIPFQIRGDELSLQLCNNHTMKIVQGGKWAFSVATLRAVKLIPDRSTSQNKCKYDTDQKYIQIFKKAATIFKFGGINIQDIDGVNIPSVINQMGFSRGDGLDGDFTFSISLTSDWTDKKINLNGCNKWQLEYKAWTNGQIEFIANGKKSNNTCKIDKDQIITKALLSCKAFRNSENITELILQRGIMKMYEASN